MINKNILQKKKKVLLDGLTSSLDSCRSVDE